MSAKRMCCNKVLKNIMIMAVGAVIAMLLMFIATGDRFQYFSQRKITTQTHFSRGIEPDSINIEFYHLNSSVHLGNECVKTKTVPPVTVCIYPVESDIYMSNNIKRYGRWEPLVTILFLEVLQADPSSVFLDLGSSIGYYSLLAAKAGHLVVSVEPNIRSILRLHQSVELEGLKGKVIVLKNAVADRRALIVLSKSSNNQADTQVKLEMKECKDSCSPLKSIVLNDLTYLIYDLTIISNWEEETPGTTLYEKLSNFRNERDAFMAQRSETLGLYRKHPSNVVLKIDTQGFEHLILNNPDFFFDRNEVTHIFMGWNIMTERRRFLNKSLIEQKELREEDGVKVETMIRFLSERHFRPYSTTLPRFYEALNLSMWHMWPENIIWCQNSQWLFMAKIGLQKLLE